MRHTVGWCGQRNATGVERASRSSSRSAHVKAAPASPRIVFTGVALRESTAPKAAMTAGRVDRSPRGPALVGQVARDQPGSLGRKQALSSRWQDSAIEEWFGALRDGVPRPAPVSTFAHGGIYRSPHWSPAAGRPTGPVAGHHLGRIARRIAGSGGGPTTAGAWPIPRLAKNRALSSKNRLSRRDMSRRAAGPRQSRRLS